MNLKQRDTIADNKVFELFGRKLNSVELAILKR